jgi:hypothetical protein
MPYVGKTTDRRRRRFKDDRDLGDRALAVRLYQFLFFDARGETPVMDLGHHEDDGRACSAATRLLQDHRSAAGVDIYDLDRLVLRVERPVDGEAGKA